MIYIGFNNQDLEGHLYSIYIYRCTFKKLIGIDKRG
jgi:hypothetical protein